MKKHQWQSSNRRATLLLGLAVLNAALLVASNAGAAKIIHVGGGLSASAAVITYILAVLIIDLVNEFYGPQIARSVVNTGLGALVISVLLFQVFILLPVAESWTEQSAYARTLGPGPRILLGGWAAYVVAQPLNVWIFAKVRELAPGGSFVVRKMTSTLGSQFVDTVIFVTIAFYGVHELLPFYLGQYLIKVVLVVLEVPLALTSRLAIRSYLEPRS